MTSTTYPLAAALTATTGRVLGDMSDFHRLADLFHPGIMTLGLAAMADDIRARVLAQYPDLPTTAPGVCDEATARAFVAQQEAVHGSALVFAPDDGPRCDPLTTELDFIRQHKANR